MHAEARTLQPALTYRFRPYRRGRGERTGTGIATGTRCGGGANTRSAASRKAPTTPSIHSLRTITKTRLSRSMVIAPLLFERSTRCLFCRGKLRNFAGENLLKHDAHTPVQFDTGNGSATMTADEVQHALLEAKGRATMLTPIEVSLHLGLFLRGKLTVQVGVQLFNRLLTVHSGRPSPCVCGSVYTPRVSKLPLMSR